MTGFEKQLFVGDHLRLTAVDAEKDAMVESGWSYNLDYAIRLREELPRRVDDRP